MQYDIKINSNNFLPIRSSNLHVALSKYFLFESEETGRTENEKNLAVIISLVNMHYDIKWILKILWQ